MGYHLVGEVLGHAPDLPYREFRILLALALDATDSTRLAKPGLEKLARHGNCSTRTAKRTVDKLRARGYVKTDRHSGPGRRAVYAILPVLGTRANVVAPEQGPQTVARDQVPSEDQQVPPARRTGATHRVAPPKPTAKPKPSSASLRTTRTGSKGRAAATADDDFDSICDKLGATGPQRDYIRSLAAHTADLTGYVRQYVESADGGESFMRHVRRMTDEASSEPDDEVPW